MASSSTRFNYTSPRYQTLADLALADESVPGTHSRDAGSRQRRGGHSELASSLADNGCGRGGWCISGAIVALLMILSLICLSEGWLEALGLSGQEHLKDCLSPTFTKSTLKLLHEEPMQRLAKGYGRNQHLGHQPGPDVIANTAIVNRKVAALMRSRKAEPDLFAHLSGRGIRSSVDLADYYAVFSNSFHIAKFSSDLDYRQIPYGRNQTRDTNKLLPWPGKDLDEPSSFEGLSYNTSSHTWLILQVRRISITPLHPTLFPFLVAVSSLSSVA
jgi:hypothetical protein